MDNQIENSYQEITKSYRNYTGDLDLGNSYDLSGYTHLQTINQDELAETSPTEFINLNNVSTVAHLKDFNPRKPFNCNFSFDINLDINLKLPKIAPASPDFSLLYKIDDFSLEVSKLNKDLIRAIRSLQCCDVFDHGYNTFIVPFFRWFADSSKNDLCEDGSHDCGPMLGGETFPEILISIAEPLIIP